MTPHRLIVLGAGAIGAGVGALLHASGQDVVLVARGENGRALAAGGVDLRRPGGASRVPVPTVLDLGEVGVSPDDLVLVCTMGHDTLPAVAPLSPAVPVVSLQNGLGPAAALADRGHPTLAAVVWIAAERRAPGVVVLSGQPNPGTILLGGWPGGAPPLARFLVDALAHAGLGAQLEPDLTPWMRAKHLSNLGGVVVALCDDPPNDVLDAARAEAIAVWEAAGLPWRPTADLLDRIGPYTLADVDGRPRVGGSTRHALARGDPLESAALHGEIVALGRRHGVPTPVNAALITCAEQAFEAAHPAGSWSADRLRQAVCARV